MVFNVSLADLINIFLIAAGIGVCGLCFLHISGARHLRKEVRKYFQIFFLLIVFYVSTHLVRQLMNGLSGDGVHTALLGKHLHSVGELYLVARAGLGLRKDIIYIRVAKTKQTPRKRHDTGLFGLQVTQVITLR